MGIDELTYAVRGAIFEVHKVMGPGLLEECYRKALLHELRLRGLRAQEEVKQEVFYKGLVIKDAYRIDILVEDEVVIELKSVERLLPIHFKQLSNYLHLRKNQIGFLVNFNSEFLKDRESIKKVFNNEVK